MRHIYMPVIVLLGLCLSLPSHANPIRKRTGQWEVSVIFKNMDTGTITGPGSARTAFDTDNGWGFSVGYNIDSNLKLSYEFTHNQPRYTVDYIDENDAPASIRHRADFYTNTFNVTYHLSQGRFTPYVNAGLGWATVDSNISDGRSYCAPDYYWGWYCYKSSYSETNWTYNINAGLRFDISRNLFVQGNYGRQWIDFTAGSSNPSSDIWKVELGFRFY